MFNEIKEAIKGNTFLSREQFIRKNIRLLTIILSVCLGIFIIVSLVSLVHSFLFGIIWAALITFSTGGLILWATLYEFLICMKRLNDIGLNPVFVLCLFIPGLHLFFIIALMIFPTNSFN